SASFLVMSILEVIASTSSPLFIGVIGAVCQNVAVIIVQQFRLDATIYVFCTALADRLEEG
ncbi:MAG: hypothetical protein ACKO7W_19970, partial [Elainella sp.]